MRHRNKKTTLGREAAQRKALLRGLAETLVLHESIRTTQAKAKALRGIIEPLITTARGGSLTNRRQVAKTLYTKAAVDKLMKEIAPRYRDRQGGYTRMTKIAPRANDGAEMVKIEFV